eukprot:876035-Prymnesium_polylepis.1
MAPMPPRAFHAGASSGSLARCSTQHATQSATDLGAESGAQPSVAAVAAVAGHWRGGGGAAAGSDVATARGWSCGRPPKKSWCGTFAGALCGTNGAAGGRGHWRRKRFGRGAESGSGAPTRVPRGGSVPARWTSEGVRLGDADAVGCSENLVPRDPSAESADD